jgi:hypothetical protein
MVDAHMPKVLIAPREVAKFADRLRDALDTAGAQFGLRAGAECVPIPPKLCLRRRDARPE